MIIILDSFGILINVNFFILKIFKNIDGLFLNDHFCNRLEKK